MFLLPLLAGCRIDRDGDGHHVPMDCDDEAAAVHPGAGETCGNGVDDDCDRHAVGCGPAGWVPVADADAHLGMPDPFDRLDFHFVGAVGVGDADGDGRDDVAVRAGVREAWLDAIWLLPGPVTGNRTLALDDATYAGLGRGDALAGGDLDGDGIAEIVFDLQGDDGVGRVSVLGGPVGVGRGPGAVSASVEVDSPMQDAALLVAGDTDGDGVGDLVLGDASAGFTARGAGAVWVVPGPVTGVVSLSRLDALHGVEAGDDAGVALAATDIDGDGLSDVLVSSRTGVRLVRGPVGAGSLAFADAAFEVCCYVAIAAADADGDGYGDVLVGAAYDRSGETVGLEDPGAAFLLRGPLEGALGVDAAVATIRGEPGTDSAGRSVALPGDLDGDGRGELVLTGSVGWAHAAFVFPGSVAGTLLTGDAAAVVYGDHTYAGPELVGPAGDGDADGFADLLAVDANFTIDGEERITTLVMRGGVGF